MIAKSLFGARQAELSMSDQRKEGLRHACDQRER